MTRAYSTTAYYLPNAERQNLVLLTGATVQKVVLGHQGQDWVARGVRFSHGKAEFEAKASQEVIISCGSVASPQLLELSGIGNPSVLESANIPVKVASANVGEHLQDHMSQSKPPTFLAFHD